MAVGYARDNPNDEIPYFQTLAQWVPLKSTKMDMCARMCVHLLSRDDAPPLVFEGGSVTFNPIPETQPGEIIKRDTKIVIYQEFTCLGSLLQNVSQDNSTV